MIQIFATNSESVEEITDLYWFEENGVHGFDDEGGCNWDSYTFEIFIDGVKVYPKGKAND